MTHPLPSDHFSMAVHFDVIRRFMSVSRNGAEPVPPATIEGGEVPSGAASSNAPFLADTGLLIEEAAGKFKPTPVAMQFINTLAGDEQRGRRVLQSLVNRSWFGRSAAALRYQNPTARGNDLWIVLAKDSGAPIEARNAGIRIVVEYLAYTGLIPEEMALLDLKTGPVPTGLRPAADKIERPSSSPTDRGVDHAGWKVIRTSDFDLSIRPDAAAIEKLRRQLDLLVNDIPGATKRRSPR